MTMKPTRKKCYQANLTPMKIFFDINDLSFSTKSYMEMFQYYYPNTLNHIRGRADCVRLSRFAKLHMHFTSSSYPSIRSPFYKSFFYRVVHTWKSLPLNLRNIANIHSFKQQAICHYLNAHSMPNHIEYDGDGGGERQGEREREKGAKGRERESKR